MFWLSTGWRRQALHHGWTPLNTARGWRRIPAAGRLSDLLHLAMGWRLALCWSFLHELTDDSLRSMAAFVSLLCLKDVDIEGGFYVFDEWPDVMVYRR